MVRGRPIIALDLTRASRIWRAVCRCNENGATRLASDSGVEGGGIGPWSVRAVWSSVGSSWGRLSAERVTAVV